MRTSRKFSFSSSTFGTVTYTSFYNDHTNTSLPPQPHIIHIPIHYPETQNSITPDTAAAKIQSTFRAHRTRSLIKTITAVNSEANHLQLMIQEQETVDAIRTDEREKMKMNEALMSLLLRLDSVPGIDPAVRELRRSVSRRIVAMQEVLDAISESRDEFGWDGFLRSWDEDVAEIERSVCTEGDGGYEMERFIAENLGFRCLQSFLRSP